MPRIKSNMKIVYIAHPISGDIENNLTDLRRIVRKINIEHKNIVPFVPYYVDIVSLDDNVAEERLRGIANDTAIIESGIINEMWLTGQRISKGMEAEKDLAIRHSIEIVDMIGKI